MSVSEQVGITPVFIDMLLGRVVSVSQQEGIRLVIIDIFLVSVV